MYGCNGFIALTDSNTSPKALHYRNRNNVVDEKSSCELRLTCVDSSTIEVLLKKHIGKNALINIHRRATATAIIIMSSNSSIDELVSSGVSGIVVTNLNSGIDREHLSISPDRNNLCRIDSIGVANCSTVTYKNLTSDFLLKHASHFHLKPCYYVEVCDVENIVSVKSLLLIDCCRFNVSLKQSKLLVGLFSTLDITLSSCFILCNISKHCLNAAERSMLNAVHYLLDPSVRSLNELGSIRKGLVIGEELLDLSNAMRKEVLLDRVYSAAGSLLEYVSDLFLRMRKNGLSALSINRACFKYTVFHITISIFFI